MRVSARNLRSLAARMFRAVRNGRRVTLTFRGQEIATVVPAAGPEARSYEAVGFGLWKGRRIPDVESHLARLRGPRFHG